MKVGIAGGHGKIALELTRLLAGREDEVVSLIRNPDGAADVRDAGGEPVRCDLEHAAPAEVAAAIEGCDAVVFAAGAGPGSGAERKDTMDYGGAVLLIEAAKEAGVERYLMISAMGADAEHPGEEVFDVYLRAKGRADAALAGSGLAWIVLRPGGLTDEEGTGRVELAESVEPGQVPRADVAAVLAALLRAPQLDGRILELVGGEQSIEDAIASL
jgi:uncharacterized protein YbjT (DUF2867 family)